MEKTFSKIFPDLVIVTASMSHVNRCEAEIELSYKHNVGLIINTLNIMKQYSGKKIVFFSTDYLFDGKNGPYSEDAVPNPINVYGKHKLECEKSIINSNLDYLILRTTGVFGWEQQRKNFMYRVMDTLNSGRELVVPNDQFANPTYVKDLISATMVLLEKNQKGIFNVAGPEVINRETLARRIASFYHLGQTLIKGEPTSYFKDLAPRPLKSGLDISKISNLGIKMRTVEKSLLDMKRRKQSDDRYE